MILLKIFFSIKEDLLLGSKSGRLFIESTSPLLISITNANPASAEYFSITNFNSFLIVSCKLISILKLISLPLARKSFNPLSTPD